MATNFPGGIDTFSNPTATSSLDAPSHSGLHTNMNDAMTAVQTQLVNQPYGLIHIETQSFSAVSAVSFSNNVFSSTYKNYKLLVNLLGTNSTGFNLRWRTAGTDNTSATYYDYFSKPATNSSSFSSNFNNGGTSALLQDTSAGANNQKGITLDIFDPNTTNRTYYAGNHIHSSASSAQPYYGGFTFGGFNNNTVFDSLTLFPSAGTITGTMSIYGYKS